MDEFTRVLVTGGAGFIGSHYIRYALRRHPGWRIVVLDRLTYAGNVANLHDVLHQITFVRGDICNPRDVRRAAAGADAIVHCAAETHVDRSFRNPSRFVKTNVAGTDVLLSEAIRAGVWRFLHVSTDEVYGDLSGTSRSAVETDEICPRSPYARTKARAEDSVFARGAAAALDVVVTRGSNTYGSYQYPEKLIPLCVTNALDNQRLPLYGTGAAVRDYLHVADHCAGIDVVLHKGLRGEAYNLGARTQVSGLEVARRVLGLLGKSTDLIEFIEDRPSHDYRYSVDPSKAEALGWTRMWTFDEGLAHVVAWYAEHTQWWRELKRRANFHEHQRKWYAPRSLTRGAGRAPAAPP